MKPTQILLRFAITILFGVSAVFALPEGKAGLRSAAALSNRADSANGVRQSRRKPFTPPDNALFADREEDHTVAQLPKREGTQGTDFENILGRGRTGEKGDAFGVIGRRGPEGSDRTFAIIGGTIGGVIFLIGSWISFLRCRGSVIGGKA